jgi:hypothetical protein
MRRCVALTLFVLCSHGIPFDKDDELNVKLPRAGSRQSLSGTPLMFEMELDEGDHNRDESRPDDVLPISKWPSIDPTGIFPVSSSAVPFLLSKVNTERRAGRRILLLNYGDKAAATNEGVLKFAESYLDLPISSSESLIQVDFESFAIFRNRSKYDNLVKQSASSYARLQQIRRKVAKLPEMSGYSWYEPIMIERLREMTEALFESESCGSNAASFFSGHELRTFPEYAEFLHQMFLTKPAMVSYSPTGYHFFPLRDELELLFDLADQHGYYVITVFPYFSVEATIQRNRNQFLNVHLNRNTERAFLRCPGHIAATRPMYLQQFVSVVLGQSREAYVLDSTYFRDPHPEVTVDSVLGLSEPQRRTSPSLAERCMIPNLNGFCLFYYHRLGKPLQEQHLRISEEIYFTDEASESPQRQLPYHPLKDNPHFSESFLGCGLGLELEPRQSNHATSNLFFEWLFFGCFRS